MWKKGGVALVGDRLGEARLAGAGRPVEQHPLRRIDPQPLEQLGIAERQLDHLAHLVDRRAEPADIVVGDVGAARLALRLLIFRAQLDLGVRVDVDDTLRRGRDDDEADLLQREGRRVQHLAKLGRHVAVIDALLAGGGDDVAGDERLHPEAALQRLARSLEAEILLRGREHDAGRRFGFGLADLHEVARADAGIGALEPVQPQDLQPLVLGIGQHRARGGRALPDDLDHVALGEPESVHRRPREPCQAAARIVRPGIGDLQLPTFDFGVGHRVTLSCRLS